MAVLTCAHCGAPRHPGVAQCRYCGSYFADGASSGVGPAIDRDIEELLRKKNLIGAIKVYRERHKASLRDAKDAVETMQKRLGL